jgi:hypothetical protein
MSNSQDTLSPHPISEHQISADWMQTPTPGLVSLSEVGLEAARRVLAAGWLARAKERGSKAPESLDGACKFATLFFKLAFGGIIAGSYEHQFNVLNGQRIDLVGIDDYADVEHDPEFFGNDEHVASMRSCLARVQIWLDQLVDELRTQVAGPHPEPLYRMANDDLLNVSEWLRCGVDEIEIRFETVSIDVFRITIDECRSTYLEFPEDEARMNVIAEKLHAGDTDFAVFVQDGDTYNFILEGRHRIVAFDEVGMDEVLVAYVRQRSTKAS